MRRRGSILLVCLFLLLVVSMLTTALFKLHLQSLSELSLRRERQQAAQQARGGLNHVLHLWTYNPAWASGLNTVQNGEGYRVTFSSSYGSVNNLANASAASGANYRGEDVPPYSADVVVTGISGRAQVRLHGLVQHGLQFNRSLGALGKISLLDDCEVRGIRSFYDPTEVGGGMLSKHQMSSSGDWAIEHSGPGTLTAGTTSRIEALPQPGHQPAISPTIHAALPLQVRENSLDTPLPEYDVQKLMNPHLSDPAPIGLSGSTLGTTAIGDSRCVHGNLAVNGDLVFGGNGSLYVDGDLTLNGGVIGEGAIYCNGRVTIQGGSSSLITNQGNGAALFARGDVELHGQSAVGYLNALGAAHPAIQTKWTAVQNQFAQIKNTVDSAPDPATNLSGAASAAQSLWGLNWVLSKKEVATSHPQYGAGVTGGQNWINSIPSPNGTYADAGSDALLPSLVDEIRTSLGPAYATDLRAQRIVHGLEETHYYFRHNNDTASLNAGATIVNNRLVGGGTESLGWDDASLQQSSWNFEHGVISSDPWGTPQLDQLQSFLAGLRGFYDNHPMDFSWLGSSNFQGIIYTQGNVNVTNRFDVNGLIVSGGQVSLSGGSKLVYNEEYVRQGGLSGPLRCQFVHEI